jgi:nucleoside transporter
MMPATFFFCKFAVINKKSKIMNLKIRLAVMNFLEFAVWGAYLTCMGIYLGRIGLGSYIGLFFAMQGIVSIFMPALMGIIADRWIPAQKTLGLCHLMAGVFMILAALYGRSAGVHAQFSILFTFYSISVAFFMPTIALANSVAYNALTNAGMDTVKDFPPIRVFGTIGFIISMWFVDIVGFKSNQYQFMTSGALSIVLFIYTFTLPNCPVTKNAKKQNFVDMFGLRAFTLFKQKKMAIFFIFSMFLGVSLQITNGFATPYIESFKSIPDFAGTFGVKYPVVLYSISQVSETCCILLIPFFMKRYGIKKVMLIAMFAWVFRFGLLGTGNPGSGLWMLILSMIIYGVAFDFFNISGSLFVDKCTTPDLRSSAQGLFMLMTNGIGATTGSLAAQQVVNVIGKNGIASAQCWFTFATYAFIVGLLFALIFRPKKEIVNKMS